MKPLSVGVHERIKLYIVLWLIITAIVVTFLMISGFGDEPIVCVDGTIVETKEECPQCVTDEDCGIDLRCSAFQCLPIRCNFDADCQLAGNECIFGQCQYIGETDLPEQ